MTEPISRTELYQRVDQAFYEAFPDAPAQIGARGKPEWREWWIKERDRQLNEEVNRVYWDRYPDAPTQLDDTSPEWEKWRVSWQNIWHEVMDNAPEPEDVQLQNAVGPEGDLDLSYFKAAVREYLVDRKDDILPDTLDDVIAAADLLIAEVGAKAMAAGTVDGEWESSEADVRGRGNHRVRLTVLGWWDSHYFTGAVKSMTTQSEDAEAP